MSARGDDGIVGEEIPSPREAPSRPAGAGRRLRRAFLGAAVLAALTAPWWGPPLLAQLAFFRVRRVEVAGARYIPARDILRRLGVDTSASVWDPLAPLERRVAAHPSVRRVSIARRLPGTLVVTVREWQPVALVPGPDGLRAVDQRGVPLPADPARTVVDVPVLVQRDTAMLRLLGELLEQGPALFRRVSEVRRAERGELVIRLGALPVRARGDVTPQRLWDVEPVEQDLARRQRRVVELDLRFRDQVIARVQ